MVDFNSSEAELGESHPRYTGLGKRSIELMAENAMADRLQSKRMSKNLVTTLRSPNTEYQCELWHARLCAFREYTLGIKQ